MICQNIIGGLETKIMDIDHIEVRTLNCLKAGKYLDWETKVKDFETVEIKEIKQQLFKLTKRPNNGLDKFAKNLTIHEFDANHYSIMLDEKHLKRVVKIIEDDMNAKIKAWLATNNKQLK